MAAAGAASVPAGAVLLQVLPRPRPQRGQAAAEPQQVLTARAGAVHQGREGRCGQLGQEQLNAMDRILGYIVVNKSVNYLSISGGHFQEVSPG